MFGDMLELFVWIEPFFPKQIFRRICIAFFFGHQGQKKTLLNGHSQP